MAGVYGETTGYDYGESNVVPLCGAQNHSAPRLVVVRDVVPAAPLLSRSDEDFRPLCVMR